MIPIPRAFWGAAAGLTLLWLLADPGVFAAEGLFPLRQFLSQWSGVLAMAAMSMAMILALRPARVEGWFGGLDKMYRLHKWLGIGGLVAAIGHWLIVNGPRWAVGWGWLEPPVRGTRPASGNALEALLAGLRDPAEGLGNILFYAVAALILVALVPTIPYGWFRRLHRLLPVAYLGLVFHAVVLTAFDNWLTPLGLVMAMLMAGGSYAAAVSLAGRIGVARRFRGTVVSLQAFPGVRALRTAIRMAPGWPGHAAGQFAFALSDPREGAHPYTIASAWSPQDREIVFVTKALGDWTARLERMLRPGQEVTLEGPYGRFNFEDDRPGQIWVGGGIGITPFIARMDDLARGGAQAARKVHLFHTTAEVDEAALQRLAADAKAANIVLHVLLDARDGLLTGARIREEVPDWREASLWFCGPAGFGDALRRDFAAQGFDTRRRFHEELFAMR